jgi:hypothetical protein
MDKVDTFVEPINTRGLRTRVLRELCRPGLGHETGSARSMSCMPNARMPMLSVPIELRLQTGAKIKADERPEGPCKNDTFEVSGNADHHLADGSGS